MTSPLWIDPHLPVVPELARIAELDLDDAIAALTVEPGSDPDPEAFHLARKRLKRLRALVRLGRAALGRELAREENNAYRDLARQLSGRRDADALVETVERLQAVADHDDADLAAGLATLHRRVSAAAGRDDDEPSAAADVRAGLVAARERAGAWCDEAVAEPDDVGWDLLEPGFRRQYGKGRDALDELGDLPGNDQLHEWRKRVKDHWHHLELLGAAWPKVLKATAKEVHHLADLLGDDHDLAELQAAHGPDLDAPVAALVEDERERLQTDAQALGAKVHAESPKRLGRRLGAYWAER